MKVAVIANTGLGDALLMMIVANNFAKRGDAVTLYSNFLSHLAPLFPHVTVAPYSKELLLEEFDKAIFQQHSPGSKNKLPAHASVIKKDELDLTRSFASNLRDVCEKRLDLVNSTTDLGLKVPGTWKHRVFPKRVVIHPSSADPYKNWPQEKFIHLARQLQKEGYEPHFTLPPAEAAQWKPTLLRAGLPAALSLSWMPLAQFIYESGYMIGNDASPAHLASSLSIPTLSIFDRTSRARFWRPGWNPGEIVLPYPILIGRTMRKALWKRFLPVSRVRHSFETLVLKYSLEDLEN